MAQTCTNNRFSEKEDIEAGLRNARKAGMESMSEFYAEKEMPGGIKNDEIKQ